MKSTNSILFNHTIVKTEKTPSLLVSSVTCLISHCTQSSALALD